MSLSCFRRLCLAIFLLSHGMTHAWTVQSYDVGWKRSPDRCWLALVTEPDACKSDERLEETYTAIERATRNQDMVDLVSIRLARPTDQNHDSDYEQLFPRAVELTKRLVDLSSSRNSSFRVVCSSDWVDAAIQGRAHGVHVKEQHLSKIPTFRESFDYDICIGTSTHSVESATASYRKYQPDYYFVGTCFVTASHPEKSIEDLEGPTLPGSVKQSLLHAVEPENDVKSNPTVIAIGGIDQQNCHIPVQHGADGVAVIRSVMQANDPSSVVASMQQRMRTTLKCP
eukprot:scaffold584_cov132-Cylindrotheca_fusiformis.AAC.33